MQPTAWVRPWKACKPRKGERVVRTPTQSQSNLAPCNRKPAHLRYHKPVPTYHVESFGCRATQADGAALERQFETRGLTQASAAQADLVIVNTCTVTNSADQDARAAIRRVQRQNPRAKIIVTGCYAQRAPQEIAALPGVACVIGNSHKHQLAEIVLEEVAPRPEGFVSLAALSGIGERPTTSEERPLFVSDIFAHTE